MKTINLTAVTFQPTLGGEEISRNFYKVVAEAVYQNAQTLEDDEFSRRLYKADGDIEVSDEELNLIRSSISDYKYYIKAAILKALE